MIKRKNVDIVIDYLIILFGAAIYAVSVSMFTSPNDIAPGGLTGIAIMLNHLFLLPIGITILVLNIPLFVWGAIVNGRRFLTKTVVATIFVSLLIDAMSYIPYNYVGDTLLASIFGGLISGVGLAIIFYRGGTTGGIDIIARNIHGYFPHISMGTIMMAADVIIIVAAAIVYKSIENGLYAVIAIFVSSKVIDSVIYGIAHDNGKLMFIITEKSEELSPIIIKKVGRGVTLLDAHGGYDKDDKQVLLCAVRPSQVYRAKALVLDVDPDAFIVVTTATAISGKGFYSAGTP